MIVLIDFSNLVWSSFFTSITMAGIKAEDCHPSYTDHVFVFRDKLEAILNKIPSQEYIFALDKNPKKKYELYPEYKKGRSSGALNIKPRDAVLNMLKEWQSQVLIAADHEADDAIASFVYQNPGQNITVVSTDKDLWQLLSFPKVFIYNFHSKEYVNKENLKDKFKLDNYQHVSMYLTLWGDYVDNIPNRLPYMKKQLLPVLAKTNGSLDGFISYIEENKDDLKLTAKCKTLLKENRQGIDLNYELVKLNYNCALERIPANLIG
jgi:5'-3' exonuclease